MGLGNSGATVARVSVVVMEKRGGRTDLGRQADLAHRLGDHVCPRIYTRASDHYLMEELVPNLAPARETIQAIYDLLHTKVWRRPAFDALYTNWTLDCATWFREHAPWIDEGLFWRLYHHGGMMPTSLIHGDPTLANAMRRSSGELCLIDPEPCRPGVPPLVEVDVGKMLQSVAGWEGVKSRGVPSPVTMGDTYPWDAAHPQQRARYYFWGAFHCARVARHVTPETPHGEEILRWSRRASSAYAQEMLSC